MYKSIPCISQPPILEPKIEFFLFPGKNFLEKLIFSLKNFFQVHYGYTKNLSETFFDISFSPMYKSSGYSLDQFLGCKRSTYTWVHMD